MNSIFVSAAAVCLLAGSLCGQSGGEGVWAGTLDTGGGKLRLVMHITKDASGVYTTKLDSPDQGAFGIPVAKTKVTAEGVTLELPDLTASFEGTLSMDGKTLTGEWKQGGGAIPLTLTRTTEEAVKPKPMVKGRALLDGERAFAIGHMERTRDLALNATKDLSAEQAKFKAGPDRWSVLEVMEHLAVMEDFLFGFATKQVMQIPANFGLDQRTAEQMAEADRKIMVQVIDRSTKGQAPEPAKPAGRYATLAEARKDFEARRARTIAYLRETQDDLRNHGAPTPGGGANDAYQFLLILAGHTERHTLQMQEVKATAGYPAK
jgi:hypothetical protein